jgi:hypothetical protein
MLERAADWLEGSEMREGGWGYTESTGADADSSALGILFLGTMGRAIPHRALQRLISFARDDGGFATYGSDQSFGAWTASHVEVTATAALALRLAGTAPELVHRAEAFLHRRRRSSGLWNSYWWTSPFYATEVALRVLGGPAPSALETLRSSNPFEEALRQLVLPDTSGDLSATQLPDGSWPCAPVLRLTRRDIFDPLAGENAGPCFPDPQRIFTTATVLSALINTHSRNERYSRAKQKPELAVHCFRSPNRG